MGQELTNPSTDGARIAARVGALYSSIERDHHLRDTLPAPIDGETRQVFEEHRRTLHSRLRSISEAVADRQAAGKAIGVFLLGYLNARTTDAPVTLASYVSTLNDQPLFAILQAIEDFKNGRVFDLNKDGERIPFTIDHAPSAPRLLDQAKKRAGDVQEERHKVTRLLAVDRFRGPDVPPEERERVGALMSDLASTMKMSAAKDRDAEIEKTRAEAQEARDRAKRIIQEAAARREQAHAG